MEGKEEDVSLRDINFSETQPIRTATQADKHYAEPPPAPLLGPAELSSWSSFYRARIAEFTVTFLFLYITILTVTGVVKSSSSCSSASWALGGMIFALAYCTDGISSDHNTFQRGYINPAATVGLFLARKLSLARALFYIVMQCLGVIGGAAVVKGLQKKVYENNGGGYTKGNGLGAELLGTFVLVYIVISATDAKRSARESRVPILDHLSIGFTIFLIHLPTIPISGTSINPARSLGAAIIYNMEHAWDDHWIFMVGPFIGAALAALCYQILIKSRA